MEARHYRWSSYDSGRSSAKNIDIHRVIRRQRMPHPFHSISLPPIIVPLRQRGRPSALPPPHAQIMDALIPTLPLCPLTPRPLTLLPPSQLPMPASCAGPASARPTTPQPSAWSLLTRPAYIPAAPVPPRAQWRSRYPRPGRSPPPLPVRAALPFLGIPPVPSLADGVLVLEPLSER
jgi:hypothetical protein